jgi:hypothetical protein
VTRKSHPASASPPQHPKAAALAAQYGARYEDVAALFAQGYPLAEIERALRLGKELRAEASDILAIRDAGFDWREVRKALDTIPDTGHDEEDG